VTFIDGDEISKITVDDNFKYAGKFKIPGQKGQSFVFAKSVTNSIAVAYVFNPYWSAKRPGAACARDCFVVDNKDFELNGESYDSMICIHRHERLSSKIYTLERSIRIETREGYNLALLYLQEFPDADVPFGNWHDQGITEKQKKIIAKFDKDIQRFISLTGKPE